MKHASDCTTLIIPESFHQCLCLGYFFCDIKFVWTSKKQTVYRNILFSIQSYAFMVKT